MTIPYSELHGELTPEVNAELLKIAAEIIRTAQLRSIGVTNETTN